MLTHSTEINEIAAALAKAQAAMDNASKDRTNPAFKSKYADMASVRDAVNGPLSSHGIAYVQAAATTADGVTVETRLIHSSGQWLSSVLGAAPKGYDAQSIGSTITYLRRYGLMALTGIAPEDDDGNAGSGRQDGPPAWQSQPREQIARQEAPKAPAKWRDDTRKSFCAELDKLGIKYDNVAAWSESLGRPRPSVMESAQRSALLQALLGSGRARFDAFMAEPDSE